MLSNPLLFVNIQSIDHFWQDWAESAERVHSQPMMEIGALCIIIVRMRHAR
jgi:hypothetical protein